jgi:PAS domain S-box-containing protein
VFESCPLPFSITTLKEGRFLDVNAAFAHRYGYSRNEILGRTVQELRIWEDPTDRGLMLARLNQGAPIRNMMTRLRTKSGQIKLTAYSASKIQFEGETCILTISEDVHQDDSRKNQPSSFPENSDLPLQQLSALARAARCTIPANRIEIQERQAENPQLTNGY